MKSSHLILLFAWALAGIACQKDPGEYANHSSIELWIRQEYNPAAKNWNGDAGNFKGKEKLISNEEILAYHAAGHYFTLTAAAINRLKNIKSKTPFYLQVNNQTVYTGFLMPAYLNVTCTGITIDPVSYSNNAVRVRLIYPASGQRVKDLRNDAYLLNALETQGKLKK